MTIQFQDHAPIDRFEIIDGELCLCGEAISVITDRVGQTPLYLYSRALIEQRIKFLRDTLPAALELHYAIKANPMPELVSMVGQLVDGLDVASSGEIDVALAAGVDPATISFAGPGKSDAELAHAIAVGITLNVESEGELDRIVGLAGEGSQMPKVALRVNPAFELRQSGMKMGGGAKPFGIDEELVPDILTRLAGLPVEFVGFHIFAGSQGLDEDVLIDCHEKTIDLAIRLIAQAPCPVSHINIGGGYGIPYFPGDKPLPLDRLSACLEACLAKLEKASPGTRMILELGRYIVGEAGLYVARILDRKVSRGELFFVTDGGLHHHLALSGNFGQVIRKNYPLMIANRSGGDLVPATIVGRLCTPLDRMGDRVNIPADTQVGDLVVIFQSGAYGATASPMAFLGHGPAAEILI